MMHHLFAVLLVSMQLSTVRVRNSVELKAAITAARPGTRIELASGEYPGGFWCPNVRGEAGRPIVIAGADPQRPPVIRGGAGGFHFQNAAHLELHDLRVEQVSANGLSIDDAGDRERPVEHILINRVKFADIGPVGNFYGIKIAGVDKFRIKDCEFLRWGSGPGMAIDGVGCHEGVVEGCRFKDRVEKAARGFGAIQFKGASKDILIRSCRFENCGARSINIGGSTGFPYFRPALEKWPTSVPKYEARNVVVEGCTFLGSDAPVTFANAIDCTVRFNTIYAPNSWAIRILQETRMPEFVPTRNGAFTDNIVVFRQNFWNEGGVNVGPNTAPSTFQFARNLWFCMDNPARSRPSLPAIERGGIYGEDPLFRDASSGDLRLKTGSPASRLGAEALPK